MKGKNTTFLDYMNQEMDEWFIDNGIDTDNIDEMINNIFKEEEDNDNI